MKERNVGREREEERCHPWSGGFVREIVGETMKAIEGRDGEGK
jgi:hypothetical protein